MGIQSVDHHHNAAINGSSSPPSTELWRHSDPSSTPMWQFIQTVNTKHGLQLDGYPSLYKWSIENVALFWDEVWRFVGVVSSQPYNEV